MKRIVLPLLVVLVLSGGYAAWRFFAPDGGARVTGVQFQTEQVTRGSVISTVAASGTLEPEELVDVGSQVSGQILSFGTDAQGREIDYCSAVTNGMVLAHIDSVTYVADLDVARASQSNAMASVASAKAGLLQAEAKLKQARRNWERAQKVGVGNAISQSAYDTYEAEFDTATANVVAAKAAIMQAEASVVQAAANVEKAERNLGYCTISSPVDGIVVDRRVNLGQTVVSSMSVSSLFLLAKDLRRMQIWVSVNEADVGSIREGMAVNFTVDTFPGLEFRGTVRRIRLNATVTSNVVTYIVEVDVDNPDGKLIPYLTANVQFETARADGALVVPARALRWKPDVAAPARSAAGGASQDEVFVLDNPGAADARPRPVKVRVLVNNGTNAAVEADGLAEGAMVITGATGSPKGAGKAAAAGGEGSGGSNPFMPNMPKPPRGAMPPR